MRCNVNSYNDTAAIANAIILIKIALKAAVASYVEGKMLGCSVKINPFAAYLIHIGKNGKNAWDCSDE
jgi:hypothetical protein